MGKKRRNPGSPDSWAVQTQESKHVLPKFANLLYDNWFKRAFGSEKWKRMLLLLLREIIPERDIQSIEYSPTEHINPFAVQQQLAKGHTGFGFPASYIIFLMNFDYHGEKSRSADIMPEEQTKYIDDMTTEQDIRNQIEYSRLVGRQEGLAEGRQEGELKKALEVARTMKGLGIATDLIVKSTGLTEEEIAKFL